MVSIKMMINNYIITTYNVIDDLGASSFDSFSTQFDFALAKTEYCTTFATFYVMNK